MSQTICQNWYNGRAQSLASSTSKIDRVRPDIYSNFSKKTNHTFKTIDSIKSLKSTTLKRLEKSQADEKSEILSKLEKNEFIPKETLSQFIEKKTKGTGKRLFFSKRPGPEQKRQLLEEYLQIVKQRELEKQQKRKDDIERQQNELKKIQDEAKESI